MKLVSAFLGLVFMILLLSACSSFQSSEKSNQIGSAEITASEISFNASLCTSFDAESGANVGWKYELVDKLTNEPINGSAELNILHISGGSMQRDNYSCSWHGGEKVIISASAPGYAQTYTVYTLPVQKLVTFTIHMYKSCSGGQNLFENIRMQAEAYYPDNDTAKQEYIASSEKDIYEMIQQRINLSSDEYTLNCIEGNFGRGGYIRGTGNLNTNKTPFSFFYHWGWCSSGGSDCGYDICFSTKSKALFERVKSDTCSKLSDKERVDPYFCKGIEYDNTTIARSSCLAGKFDLITEKSNTFSIQQLSNRCGSKAINRTFDCALD